MSRQEALRSARVAARRTVDAVSSPIGSVLRFGGCGDRIALTFDDGPDPDVTPRLVALLAAAGIRATFFMLVTRVRRFPEVAELVCSSGHEVALHGLDHRRLTTLAPSEAYTSLDTGKRELERFLGGSVAWYRPPYGAHDFRIWRHVRSLGMQLVLWGPTLRDSRDLDPESRWRGAKARPGDIVLAHDGVAGDLDGVDDPPPAQLDRAGCALEAAERYRREGLTFATLSEMAATGRAVRGARWTK